MDEVVCRSDAIVIGVMDQPIETRREPFRPHRHGTPTEKVTFISRLEVSEVLWGIPSLRELHLVSGKIEPVELVLPIPPGSSRPVDTPAIWYLQHHVEAREWTVTFVTPLGPDRANRTIDHVVKRISDNRICLQPIHARILSNGTVHMELQLELRNPTEGHIDFPGFEMRDLQIHGQVPVTAETSGQGILESDEHWGVVLDPSIPKILLAPGSSRFFPVRFRARIPTVGFGSSSRIRLSLGTYGTTNWTSPILR
jgi:hypothetical protein